MANKDYWVQRMKTYRQLRMDLIETRMDITDAMENYLETVGESNDFSIRLDELENVILTTRGDLFDLEQIGDFCDVFSLDIMIVKRNVIENYMLDETIVRVNYWFQTKKVE